MKHKIQKRLFRWQTRLKRSSCLLLLLRGLVRLQNAAVRADGAPHDRLIRVAGLVGDADGAGRERRDDRVELAVGAGVRVRSPPAACVRVDLGVAAAVGRAMRPEYVLRRPQPERPAAGPALPGRPPSTRAVALTPLKRLGEVAPVSCQLTLEPLLAKLTAV